VKEKRRRVVQLSKAGLEVPEDLLPLKKKGKRSTSCDEEANLNLDSVQSYQQNASSGNDLKMTKCFEVDHCKYNPAARGHLETISKISEDVDVRSKAVTPSQEFIHKDTDNIAKDQNSTQSISCSCDEGDSTKFQVWFHIDLTTSTVLCKIQSSFIFLGLLYLLLLMHLMYHFELSICSLSVLCIVVLLSIIYLSISRF